MKVDELMKLFIEKEVEEIKNLPSADDDIYTWYVEDQIKEEKKFADSLYPKFKINRVFSQSLSQELVSVQPMSQPTARLYYMDIVR